MYIAITLMNSFINTLLTAMPSLRKKCEISIKLHTVTSRNEFVLINILQNQMNITNELKQLVPLYIWAERKICCETDSLKTKHLAQTPLNARVNVMRYFRPTNLSNLLQKGIFLPNLKKCFKNCDLWCADTYNIMFEICTA